MTVDTVTEAELGKLAAARAQLRRKFDEDQVGKLPRVTCHDCSKRDRRCSKHEKTRCDDCDAYVSTAHIHLDYVGHAAITDRLLSVDPEWNWEPVAFDAAGLPLLADTGELWIRLAVLGVTRLGVSDPGQSLKIAIGDALRNAAMRHGVGLDLWSKNELESQVDAAPADPEPEAAPDTPNLAAFREVAAGFTDEWQKLVMADARDRCGWPTKITEYDEIQAGQALILAQRIIEADEPFGVDDVDAVAPDAPDGVRVESGDGTDEVAARAPSVPEPEPEPPVEVDPAEQEAAMLKKALREVRIPDIARWVQHHGYLAHVKSRADDPSGKENKADRMTRMAAHLDVSIPFLAGLILGDLPVPKEILSEVVEAADKAADKAAEGLSVPENAGGRSVAADPTTDEGVSVDLETDAELRGSARRIPESTATPELDLEDGEPTE